MAGLSNGLAVLADEETRTYWDHITGEAFEGPLNGERLNWWPIFMTTAEAAMSERPDVEVLISPFRSAGKFAMELVNRRKIKSRGFLPPPFRLTMSGPMDKRLNKMTQGLGVIVNEDARFYPVEAIPEGGMDDRWNGRTLHIQTGEIDGVPHAQWSDGGIPMQLLTRWYGFSFTYPGCRIYGEEIG